MAHDPIAVWASMKLKTWDERYFLADIAPEHEALAAETVVRSRGRYSCVIRDQTGFSLLVDEETYGALGIAAAARRTVGPLKVISTDSELPFDVTGFIQAALKPINGQGYKAAPQCGLQADHFFTGESDIAAVEEIFRDFRKQAAGAST